MRKPAILTKPRDTEGPARILIIDDNLEFLEVLVALMEPLYQVTVAENGKRGLALINSRHFDLILLDVYMPGMDGFTVCQQLKRHEATRHLPVILMSGYLEAGGKLRALDVGAADYINKPFNLPMVNSRIQALIGSPATAPTLPKPSGSGSSVFASEEDQG